MAIISEPTFYGTNIISDSVSKCDTFSKGIGQQSWQDEAQNAAFNATVTQSTDYAASGSNSLKIQTLEPTGVAKISMLTTGGSLTIGKPYQFFCKFLVPAENSLPSSIVLFVGTTAGASDIIEGQTNVLTDSPVRYEWNLTSPVEFIAIGSAAYLSIGVTVDNSGDFIYVDDICCNSKELNWTTD